MDGSVNQLSHHFSPDWDICQLILTQIFTSLSLQIITIMIPELFILYIHFSFSNT